MLASQLAGEVLWTMVGRDREVRVSLASHGALPKLMTLTRSRNPGVSAPALLCLAAYAWDAGAPPGQQQSQQVRPRASLRLAVRTAV